MKTYEDDLKKFLMLKGESFIGNSLGYERTMYGQISFLDMQELKENNPNLLRGKNPDGSNLVEDIRVGNLEKYFSERDLDDIEGRLWDAYFNSETHKRHMENLKRRIEEDRKIWEIERKKKGTK